VRLTNGSAMYSARGSAAFLRETTEPGARSVIVGLRSSRHRRPPLQIWHATRVTPTCWQSKTSENQRERSIVPSCTEAACRLFPSLHPFITLYFTAATVSALRHVMTTPYILFLLLCWASELARSNPDSSISPWEPCRDTEFRSCAVRTFNGSAKGDCYANLSHNTSVACATDLDCAPEDVLAFRRCLRYSMGCDPPHDRACYSWLPLLRMNPSCDVSLACSPLTVAYTVLAMNATNLGNRLAELPPNTSITTLGVTANAGSFEYVEEVRTVLQRFRFDLVVFVDGLYDVVGGEFPDQKKFVIYDGATVHPNTFVVTLKMMPLGYFAGFEIGARSTTRHVAFSSDNYEGQRRQLFEGFVTGVRGSCPFCKLYLYTHPGAQWDTRVDAGVVVGTPVPDFVKYSIYVNLPGHHKITKQSLAVLGNISGIIRAATFVLPTIHRLLINFAPGSERVDYVLPGRATFKSLTPSTTDLDFARDRRFERVTATTVFDYESEVETKQSVPPQSRAGYALDVKLLPRVLEDQGASEAAATFHVIGPTLFASVSSDTADIRLFSASSLLDRNATIANTSKPSSRMHAGVAFRRSVPSIVEAYIVFGRDIHTSRRLGDIWRADSGVGDFHQYQWERVYDLSTALREDPSQALPMERYGHTASIVGNSMYVFGGVTRDGAAKGAVVTNELYRLDLSTFRWKELQLPIAGRGFHHTAVVYDPTQPTTEFEAAGVRDTQLLFVGFGTTWKSTSPPVEVIGLTTLKTATLQLPTHPNGTSMILATPQVFNCLLAVGSDIYVTEAVAVRPQVYRLLVCKYSTRLGAGWEDCRSVTTSFGNADMRNCNGYSDGTALGTQFIMFFSPDAPPALVTDPRVPCDGLKDLVPTPGGWNCVSCPRGSYAANGVCISCDDYDPDEAFNPLASDLCPHPPKSIVATAVGICLTSAACIALAAGGVYYRSQRDMRHSQGADELVEDVTRAVASGHLAPVAHLYELRYPNRMQRSLVNILTLFDVYTQFVPGWVFRGNRNANDFDDLDAKANGPKAVSRSSADGPPAARLERSALGNSVRIPSAKSSGPIGGSGRDARYVRDGGSAWGNAKASELLYRAVFPDNVMYNADLTVLCIQVQIDLGAPLAAQQLDTILRIIVNTVDDGDGLVQSMWGDQIIASYNGLMVNSQHVRDAAASVCIMSESLDAIGTRCTFGLARGYAKVGVATGICGQRSVLVGDVLERARELTVANRVLQTQILCDWALGNHLGNTFAVQLLGYWDRSVRVKYLFAELLGMAQNDDAAVRVQAAFEESKGRDRMSVRVCLKDYTAANRLMVAIDKGDDRRRDLLLQQCRLSQVVSEAQMRKMMQGGLPHFNQESHGGRRCQFGNESG
jgi:hypothetical protein